MDLLRNHEIFRGVFLIQICAFDRQQAIDLLKEEYKDDPDIEKLRITRSMTKPLSDGESLYTFFFRLGESIKRPVCEECGSEHVISRGKEWYCRGCGKYWSKIKRNRKV